MRFEANLLFISVSKIFPISHILYLVVHQTKPMITTQLINVIGSGTVITPLRRSSKEKSVTTFSVRNVLLYNILYFSSLLFDLSQHMPAQQVLGQINHDPALMVSNWTQSSLRQPTMCPGPWSIKHGLSDLWEHPGEVPGGRGQGRPVVCGWRHVWAHCRCGADAHP